MTDINKIRTHIKSDSYPIYEKQKILFQNMEIEEDNVNIFSFFN